MPWIIIIAIAVLVIEFLMVVIASFSVMYTDNGAAAMTLLPSILSSNDCTPNTHLPLRDIIAAGIAMGKTGLSDPLVVEYNSAVDKSSPEHAFSIAYCLNNISNSMSMPFSCDSKNSNAWSGGSCGGGHQNFKYNFYVKYCDYSSGKCVIKTVYLLYDIIQSSKVIESSKIALPDGTVATVFLER